MNWLNITITCLIATGGFIAASYEVMAKKMMLTVGIYFKGNGLMAILGGFLTFGAIVLSAFINPWWTIFIVFIVGWFFSQLIVSIFKTVSQLISLILIITGIVLLLIVNK